MLQMCYDVVAGKSRKTVVWDVETGFSDQRLIKGSKMAAWFRPQWIEDDSDWGERCYGRIDCLCIRRSSDPLQGRLQSVHTTLV